MKEIDPFIVTDTFKPAYFCNRKQECNELVDSLINGKNIAIIAPRRMGKTALIHHCFDKSEIGQKYYTFFINILHTSNLRELLPICCVVKFMRSWRFITTRQSSNLQRHSNLC